MEFVQKIMTGFRLDLGPLKEPLGFIRILEWFFAILSFATTGGYEGSTTMTLPCPGGEKNITAKFGYPFRLNKSPLDIPSCNMSLPAIGTFLTGDYSPSAEFFVCVGVFGFLYCTFTIILYVGYQHVYRETNRGPIVDLVITAIFAFLWLVSSSAWGKGLTDVKYNTNPDVLKDRCHPVCSIVHYPSMGRLNSSVILGFLNLVLWAGNCWFIFKETPFHKPTNPPPNPEQGGPSS